MIIHKTTAIQALATTMEKQLTPMASSLTELTKHKDEEIKATEGVNAQLVEMFKSNQELTRQLAGRMMNLETYRDQNRPSTSAAAGRQDRREDRRDEVTVSVSPLYPDWLKDSTCSCHKSSWVITKRPRKQ